MKEATLLQAYDDEIVIARLAWSFQNYGLCFKHLERAHILAQRMTLRHMYVHGLMLLVSLRQRNYREAAGQIPRIVASALFSRIWVPRGNTGSARVSAFEVMPVPEDLRHLFP